MSSKNKDKKPDHKVSSGNVFADLEIDNADELQARAKLGHTIRTILEEKGMKQREISELLEIDQAEVSKLMNGKYHLFSEGRLLSFLNKLDTKITVQISEKKIPKNTKRRIFSEMDRHGIQSVSERMQKLQDLLTPSYLSELQRVSGFVRNAEMSILARVQEQAHVFKEPPYLSELQRASEFVKNIDMSAVTRLQELTRDWAEPFNNIQNMLSSYSNKIAEINRAMSPVFEELSLKALEIQQAINEPLTKALENYQYMFRNPLEHLFPEGFFEEVAHQQAFIEDCQEKGWVPHPVLYSFFGDDFFSLSDTEQEERIKENWEEFSSLLWQRRPVNLMDNGREGRLKQIFDTQKVKAYTPVCRSVYPEIESLAYEYVRSDAAFVESLKNLSRGGKRRAVSEKINGVFKIEQSPILDLYISELGDLLGFRTVEILLTQTRAEFIPFDETDNDLSMNRHFHAHGVPFNPTFKNSTNALLLLDIALQAFSALKDGIGVKEDS